MRIGPQEFIIVLIIVLVIFGPKNLPKLGKPAETKTEEKAEKKDEE